ncbi:MAG: dienelactone hydrolase family protein [Planctomycetota bacterium]
MHISALILPVALLAAAPLAQDEMGWTGVLDEDAFAALHELREGDAPELRGEPVSIGEMDAYVSRPSLGEPLGGVVVIHEWWGLNDHVKHWADRLASDGYVALAVDLYGGEVATTREEASAAMRAVDEEAALAALRDAHAYLVEEEDAERTACIGWCFGGGWSLRLAMAESDLDAAVVYYGRLVDDPEALASIEAPMLGVFGDRDRGIPPESVDAFEAAMKKAGKDLVTRRYDADHAFANPSSGRYDAENASAAWGETRAFLCENLFPEIPNGSLAARARQLETWTPPGWTESQGSRMRVASYELPGGADCSVIALGSDGGGLLANVNRWRAQMGASDLSEDDLDDLPRVPMLGRLVPTVRIEGNYTGMGGQQVEDALMLGAIAILDREAVFAKVIGPRSSVEEQSEAFAAFCRGLR